MPRTLRTSCRCCKGNDMNCPSVLPFEGFLAKLKQAGYLGYGDEIDAARAVSLMSECSNCTARGKFDYYGLFRPESVSSLTPRSCDSERLKGNYRAFWVCLRCKHWIEV